MINPYAIYQALLDIEPDNFLLEDNVTIDVLPSGYWEITGKHSVLVTNFNIGITSFNTIKITQPITSIDPTMRPFLLSLLTNLNRYIDGTIYIESLMEVDIDVIRYCCYIPISEGASETSYLKRGIEIMEPEISSIKAELKASNITMKTLGHLSDKNDNESHSLEDRFNSLLNKDNKHDD